MEDRKQNMNKFGQYVKLKRKQNNIGLRDLADIIGISPSYLCDIENGNRCAPLNHLSNLIKVLKLDRCETVEFLDLAYSTRGNFLDINEYLKATPMARLAVRTAIQHNLTGDEFLECVLQLKKPTQQEDENFAL